MVRLTQGSPPDLASKAVIGAIKRTPIRRTRRGKGSEGGRSTVSTDDSGPEKSGNRAEDKTLTTGKMKVIKPGCPKYRHWEHGKSWAKGDCDTIEASNKSCEQRRWSQKTEGG